MFSFLEQPAAVIARAAQVPQQTIDRALSTLNELLPPNLMLGLVQRVSQCAPSDVADTLIMRSTCKLGQLRAGLPKLSLPSKPKNLLRASTKLHLLHDQNAVPERHRSYEELALIQALFELYIGLLLRLLTSSGRRLTANYHPADGRHLLFPIKLGFGNSPYADGTRLKRPTPA